MKVFWRGSDATRSRGLGVQDPRHEWANPIIKLVRLFKLV